MTATIHTDMPSGLCGCGARMNAVVSADGVQPQHGDYTVCWYCGQFLWFNDKCIPIPVSDADVSPAIIGNLLEIRKGFCKNRKFPRQRKPEPS